MRFLMLVWADVSGLLPFLHGLGLGLHMPCRQLGQRLRENGAGYPIEQCLGFKAPFPEAPAAFVFCIGAWRAIPSLSTRKPADIH